MAVNDRWIASWRRIGSVPPPGSFAALMARYREPHRHYHTLVHLEECFAALAPAVHLAERLGEVELALWFHDAVYDPRRNDNEHESARLAAETLLAAGVNGHLAERIRTLILATSHSVPPPGGDASLVVDVDLTILAAPETRFDEYEQEIRAEYAWVPEAEFRTARARILKSFLARPTIYATQWFVDKYETCARANLSRSILRIEH